MGLDIFSIIIMLSIRFSQSLSASISLFSSLSSSLPSKDTARGEASSAVLIMHIMMLWDVVAGILEQNLFLIRLLKQFSERGLHLKL